MGARLKGWMVLLLLGGVTAYAIAEEITLTTYYPSPRGVYDQLRTAGNVQFGSITPPGEVGGPPTPAPRLYLYRERDNADGVNIPLVVVEDERPSGGTVDDPTPFIIDEQGNVGIGTTGDPSTGLSAKLEVAGQVRFDNGGLCLGDDCRTAWPMVFFHNGTNPLCPAEQPNIIARDWIDGNTGALCGAEGGPACYWSGGFGASPVVTSPQYCCISGCNPCQPIIDGWVSEGRISWRSIACSP